jgi:hypothetical protein
MRLVDGAVLSYARGSAVITSPTTASSVKRWLSGINSSSVANATVTGGFLRPCAAVFADEEKTGPAGAAALWSGSVIFRS